MSDENNVNALEFDLPELEYTVACAGDLEARDACVESAMVPVVYIVKQG